MEEKQKLAAFSQQVKKRLKSKVAKVCPSLAEKIKSDKLGGGKVDGAEDAKTTDTSSSSGMFRIFSPLCKRKELLVTRLPKKLLSHGKKLKYFDLTDKRSSEKSLKRREAVKKMITFAEPPQLTLARKVAEVSLEDLCPRLVETNEKTSGSMTEFSPGGRNVSNKIASKISPICRRKELLSAKIGKKVIGASKGKSTLGSSLKQLHKAAMKKFATRENLKKVLASVAPPPLVAGKRLARISLDDICPTLAEKFPLPESKLAPSVLPENESKDIDTKLTDKIAYKSSPICKRKQLIIGTLAKRLVSRPTFLHTGKNTVKQLPIVNLNPSISLSFKPENSLSSLRNKDKPLKFKNHWSIPNIDQIQRKKIRQINVSFKNIIEHSKVAIRQVKSLMPTKSYCRLGKEIKSLRARSNTRSMNSGQNKNANKPMSCRYPIFSRDRRNETNEKLRSKYLQERTRPSLIQQTCNTSSGCRKEYFNLDNISRRKEVLKKPVNSHLSDRNKVSKLTCICTEFNFNFD